MLLTLDGDFADITACPPADHRGVVALQLHGRPELLPTLLDRLTRHLDAHPTTAEHDGQLVLVEPHRIRVVR